MVEHIVHRLSDVGCVTVVVVQIAVLAVTCFCLVEERFERTGWNLKSIIQLTQNDDCDYECCADEVTCNYIENIEVQIETRWIATQQRRTLFAVLLMRSVR